MTIVTNTYTSDTTVDIPSTAFDVTITVRSASGGIGVRSLGNGAGGSGRVGTFRFKTNYVARTLQIRIGQPGSNTGSCNFPSGFSTVGSGGCGGNSSFFDGTSSSYDGGGGAGATGILLNSNVLVIAGGGGGGVGAANVSYGGGGTVFYPAVVGGNSSDWIANFGTFSFSNGQRQSISTSGDIAKASAGGGGGGSFGGSASFRQRSPYSNTASTGGGSRYDSNELNLISSSAYSGSPSVTVSYNPTPPPEITSFTASPNPQTSGIDGVPKSTTQLSWSSTNTSSASINQSVGSVTTSGTTTIDTGLQSVAGSNSPATKSYILTVVGLDGSTVSSDPLTVSVYNDNDPPAFTIPNQTNLEPNQPYIINLGTISSSVIDMITRVTGLDGATVSRNNTNSWTTTLVIDPNDSVQVRFFSLGLNQSPDGLTNSTSYGVTIGTQTAYFTATTRAPDVNETFNLPNESDRVPYPDIDTIDEPVEQYIVSNTLSVDDIELQNPSGVEIRTNNGNAQIRKKITGTSTWGSWQDVRSI